MDVILLNKNYSLCFSDEELADIVAKTVFKEIDADDDGEITEEEFIKACLDNKDISEIIVDPFKDLMDDSDSD